MDEKHYHHYTFQNNAKAPTYWAKVEALIYWESVGCDGVEFFGNDTI